MRKLNIISAAICMATLTSFAQLTFIHITDLHVSNALSLVNSYDTNGVRFQCYIKEFATLNPKPAFVIASGDITNIGNSTPDGMYPSLTQYLFPPSQTNPAVGAYFIDSAQTIPIYFTPGNHEYYTTLIPPTNNTTLLYYPEYVSPDTDYVINTTNAVIVCMRSGYDDDRPIWVDWDITHPEGSGLSASQCSWLRNVLSANSNKRKIIVMHHPPVDANGTDWDGTPLTSVLDTADGSILNNRTTFLNICDSNHVDITLAGHVHQNVVVNRKGIVVDENCDTCGTRHVQTCAAFERSYRIITIDTSFVSVGLPMLSCYGTSGIADFVNKPDILVYPNPTTNNLNITSNKPAKIEISTIQGQLIKTLITSGAKTNVDVSTLPCGVYVVEVKTEKGIAVKKFVKE